MFKFNNYRFSANAEASQTTDPQSQTDSTKNVETDADRNFAAMRKQNEKLQKELESFKNAQSQADKIKLEEEGKFKELLEKERAEKLELQSKVTKNEQQAILSRELQNAGLTGKNLDLALLQITGKVNLSAADATDQIQSQIKEFQTDYPTLFLTPPPIQAGSTSVSATNNPSKSTMTIEEATRIATDSNAKEYLAKQAEVDAIIMKQY